MPKAMSVFAKTITHACSIQQRKFSFFYVRVPRLCHYCSFPPSAKICGVAFKCTVEGGSRTYTRGRNSRTSYRMCELIFWGRRFLSSTVLGPHHLPQDIEQALTMQTAQRNGLSLIACRACQRCVPILSPRHYRLSGF